jgi:hypothetical protein
MMSMLCNCCVRELLILARTWFAFGLLSKTGCDTLRGSCHVIRNRYSAGPVTAPPLHWLTSRTLLSSTVSPQSDP